MKGTKEKALQKENAVFAYAASAATRRATAFEKAVQNNRRMQIELPDKSKFEILTKMPPKSPYSHFLSWIFTPNCVKIILERS